MSRLFVAARVAAACVALSFSLAQTAPRQRPTGAPARSASIAGIVLADTSEAKPLRRARVFLESGDEELAGTTISDDMGRFAFTGLARGRYTVGAVKEGYVRANYGAAWSGGAGQTLALAEGQALEDVVLMLPRGATITGMLLDPEGQPVPGVAMRAFRYGYTAGGERRLLPVGANIAGHVTDDRGIYRIFGLAPGEYVVAAPVSRSQAGETEVLVMTEAEVQRALDDLKHATRSQSALPADQAAADADLSEARAVGYAHVFYPGTTLASQAVRIPLGKGEERNGIDFQLQYVRMTTISGSTYSPLGEVTQIYLIPTAEAMTAVGGGNEVRTTRGQLRGEFSFANVAPGSYTLFAKSMLGNPTGSPFWGSVEVLADGQNQPNVMLTLQQGLTVSGRVAFSGRPPLPDPTDVRVTLVPMLSGGQVSLATTPARPDASGQFTIRGVTGARYRLQASLPSGSRWMLASSTVSGRDVLDMPIDLRQSIAGSVVTFTDTGADVSGVVRDAKGKPVAGHVVILFAADRTLWTPGSRRIRAVTATADGAYFIPNVAPGEYWVSAATLIESGEQYDPVLLDRLIANGAAKTTIVESEKKSLDVTAEIGR